jgi:hypothetical protein
MRPTLTFYNHTLDGETMSAIVVFPYTPHIVKRMTPLQIFAFCD